MQFPPQREVLLSDFQDFRAERKDLGVDRAQGRNGGDVCARRQFRSLEPRPSPTASLRDDFTILLDMSTSDYTISYVQQRLGYRRGSHNAQSSNWSVEADLGSRSLIDPTKSVELPCPLVYRCLFDILISARLYERVWTAQEMCL